MATYTLTYKQSDDDSVAGIIAFNGEEKAANGRMDKIGDSVSASEFSYSVTSCDIKVTIECTRMTTSTMRVTLLFEGDCNNGGGSVTSVEQVIDHVPLS